MNEKTPPDQSIYDQLFSRFDYIISQLEISFLTHHRCSKESELYLNFHDILVNRVEKFMKVYQPPENRNEHFKLIRGFITQFRNHIYYRGSLCDCYTKTNKLTDMFVNLNPDEKWKDIKSEKYYDLYISNTNVEEQIIQMDLQNRVSKGYNLFMTYLTPFEKMFFKGMVQGKSTLSIIPYLGNGGFNPPSYDISQRIRKTLEFRLTCFFSQEREIIYDKKLVLKTLNKFSKLNKKVFGISKLNEIPSQELLEHVIKGEFLQKNKKFTIDEINEKKQIVKMYDPDSKIQIHGTKYFGKSKVDFNGKKHDHYVVYIDQYLNMYDHVTKQNKNLRIA